MSAKEWDAEQQPDNLDRFDPLKVSDWSLPMTLMWIIWRDVDRVRSQDESYDWHLRNANRLKGVADGWDLPPTKLKPLHAILRETENSDLPQNFLIRGPAAQADLWLKLGSGKLVATGKAAQSSERQPIPETSWQDFDAFDPGLGWPLDAIGSGYERRLSFNEVTVPAETVINLWPALGTVLPVDPANLTKPSEGPGRTSAALKVALQYAFPSGVPEISISSIRKQIANAPVFNTRGLDRNKLDHGRYDTTIKRLIGRAKK